MENLPDDQNAEPSGPEATRQALLHEGLRLFGEKGFRASSTREIAQGAGQNIASIAYHFGSKDGLRNGVAKMIASTLSGVVERAFAARIGNNKPDTAPDERQAAARQAVAHAVGRMAVFLLSSPMGAMIPRFVIREMADPSPAFDILYSGVFEPAHKRLCHLWAEATGEEAESEDTRLAVFSLIGPLLYFRIGAPAVQRRMGWSGYGPAEAQKIADAVARVILARIDQSGETR